ncbi:glycosyltransferase family 4 protein [Alisedimentitalea sp. MJ-SS2]|uniref:glycosyltransferase family 4 protein n=1 Tax=Aliisedimentitalea sp. MJ-SS2 TaxID=3049795 RepID=UPI00290D754E|nr:glycosyltransferase family 4 protein [Alisedimentitalea sp. MJ-SS2]MDU8926215.1 glycosyltransferase family 4 protein [Alisedimentitalea sp. MJ-SS2]
MARLKIAYLCDISPEHALPYSGGNARIFNALSEYADVTILPHSWGLAEPVRRAIYAMSDAAQLRLRWRMHLALARVISAPINRELAQGGYDAVFCAYSFQSLSRIAPPPGMVSVFTSDATPTVYKRSEIGQSFGSSWISRHLFDPLTLRAERRIFSALDLMLCPSPWLKREAEALYDLPEGAAYVLPWGANIDDPGPPPAAPPISRNDPLNLLVIGRDWFAKGGPLAFDTMKDLRARGFDARLTVIGATPPEFHRNEHVAPLGMLDKSDSDQVAELNAALAGAHFLIQPSFESYGFAFCEAAAHGLPSLCLDVGGVPVQDGVSGHPLPSGSGPADFAETVIRYLDDPAAYARLRSSSRAAFDSTLNWQAWAQRTIALIEHKLSKTKAIPNI